MTKLMVFLLSMSCSAGAATIFSDGFEATPAGLNVVPSGWTVSSGTVDVITFGCHTGSQCVDLDGSSFQAGTLSRTFSATSGVLYTLNFWLNNSQRGTNETVEVTLGTVTFTIPALSSSTPTSPFTVTWNAFSTSPATLSFHNLGGDNVGAILDDVILADNASGVIPEPGTSVLLGAGLVALATVYARRENFS